MKLIEKLKDIANTVYARNSLILNIIIIILINLVGLTLYFRIDLTRNKAYSLSDVSKEVVSTLEDPLILKVFFSKDLPAPYNSVHRYLADILEEYSESANINFQYEFIDIEEQKDLASDFGLFSVQIREIKDDQVKFRRAYMGLAIIHGDLIEKIESLTDAVGIEYKITTLIKKMTGKIDSLLKLEDPIHVILYTSSNLPVSGVGNLDKKIEEIVKKCNIKNYNKLKYRYIDPHKDKSAMDVADIYGIAKLQWPAFASMDGKRIKAGEGIVGMVIEQGDKFQTIQLLSRTIFGQYMIGGLDSLEDRINNAVDNIITVNPKIGYIIGHGEKSIDDDQGDGASNFKQLISDMYELISVNITKDEIPENITTLIINGPKNKYTDEEIFKIDQFIMNGGSVLFFLDSFNEVSSQAKNMLQRRPVVLPVNTGLESFISHFGISINKDIVLDKKCFKAMRFGGQEIYFAPIIEKEGLDPDNIITKDLKTIVFPKVSSLKVDEEKIKKHSLNKSLLVSSSSQSWLMRGRINFSPLGMQPPEESKMSKYNLAVLLSGKFESFYKGKKIPITKDKKKTKGVPIISTDKINESVKPSKIIVVSTSEITTSSVVDKDGKSPNAIFLHNMIDYIQGNFDIPEMRSKGLEYNPLSEIDESVKLILKLFNIAGLPVVVIVIGLVIWRKRVNRKKRITKEFGGNE